MNTHHPPPPPPHPLTPSQSLRESCWKARDEAATKEKAGEQKLKQVYHEAEQRCKAAKEEALRDATENHKARPKLP